MKSVQELLRFVRQHSAFYRDFYRGIPETISKLEELPILDQELYWKANSLTNNHVLTGPLEDGLVLRSGGTVGNPKFSVFTHDEWDAFTRDAATELAKSGVRDGDRVANLFYSGELYGSFLFVHRLIEFCPVKLLSLPIGGAAALPDAIKILADFKATVVAALPTTVMNLVAHLENHPEKLSQLEIQLFLFAGESMYPDQRARIEKLIPGCEIRSIGYASNDAGFLGYPDLSCGPNEFRRHDKSMVYEIVDEDSGQVIEDVGVPGRAIVTDLRRKLMPIIRYPVGDRAQWVEPAGVPDRKFLLLGRTEEAARVASLSVYFEDVRAILEGFRARLGGFQFQILSVHEGSRDGLIIRLGVAGGRPRDAALESDIVAAIHRERPAVEQFAQQGKIIPLRIEWREASALETNARTGKLKRIIDLRGT